MSAVSAKSGNEMSTGSKSVVALPGKIEALLGKY
jgi:hypothetical protein